MGNNMKTRYITWKSSGFSEEELAFLKDIIGKGGLIAFPTETVYGLGGDAFRKDASARIYQAKNRPSDNPLIVHIASFEDVNRLAESVSDTAKKLMEAFWPGPLTMIMNKKESVPYETTGGLDTVGIRMPNHKAALDFIQCVGVPIAAPSANTSGRPSPTLAAHVKEDMDGRIDGLLTGDK